MRFPISPRSAISRYAVAAVSVLVALGFRLALDPVLALYSPPFTLAIIVTTLFGGRGPGFAATALSALALAAFFPEPREPLALTLFLLTGTLIVWLVGALRGAERALRRHARLVDLAHDAIIILDAGRRITGWNRGAQELYGWTEPEVLGKRVHDLLQTSNHVSVAELDDTVFRHGRWEGELLHIARDGKRLCVESRQVLMRDEQNRPLSILEINRDVTERNRAREQTEAVGRRLTLALKEGRSGTFDWDMKTDMIFCSDELLELYGFKPGEFGGRLRDWAESLVPEDREAVVAEMRTSLETGLFEREFRIARRDTGEVRWMYARAGAVFDEAGKPGVMTGIHIDITERKLVEEELRRRTAELDSLLANAPLGFVFLDREHRHLRVNEELCRFDGVPAEAHIGRTVSEVVPALAGTVDAILDEVFTTGKAVQREISGETHKEPGVERHCLVGYTPVFGNGHEVVSVGAFVLDITERRRMEQRLREALDKAEESQRLLDALMEHVPLGIAIADAPGCAIRRLSRVAGRLMDTTREEIFRAGGRTPATEDEFPLMRAIRRGETVSGEEWTVRRKDGPETVLLCTAAPIRDEQGEIRGGVATWQDIGGLKRAQQALRASEERLARTQEFSLVMALHISLDGTYLKLPPTFVRLLGYDSDAELLGQPFKNFTHPDDFQAQWSQVERLQRGEIRSFEMEKRFIRKDGSVSWGYVNCSIVSDEAGRPVHLLAYIRDINAQKRAEEALRASEARFRALVTASSQAIYTMSPDWSEMRHLEGGNFIPDTKTPTRDWLPKYIHPEDQPRVMGAIEDAVRNKRVFELEYRVRRVDGSLGWTLSRAVPLLDASGGIVEWFGAATDISQQKQAEERLRQSESFFRQALESIPGMVFTTRPDGFCDYQSQQWVEYAGVPMDGHLGDGWNKLLHPDDRPRALAAWRAAVEERAPYDLECRVRRRDGVYEWFKVVGRPIRDDAGRVVRWFGVALNIEDLKRADAAVREALDQRNLAFEAAGMGAWDYRLETGEVLWDERSQTIFGAVGEERLEYGEAIARIHPEDRPGVDKAFREAIAGANGGTYDKEFRVVWPDGSVHWVAAHGQVFFENYGGQPRATRFVGVNIETTGRKQAEERLRHAQKLESVGLLAGGVAHDFNNLLTVIIGNAGSALEKCPSCGEYKAVIVAAQRAAQLTRQLLAYAGKGQFVKRTVDLTELVSKSRPLIEASVPKRVKLALDLAGDLPAVEEDPSRLEQILMNFVINAAEAIPPKTDGRIAIATGKREIAAETARQQSRYEVAAGTYVWLEVRDNGVGMDESTLSRVFDPFFSTKFTGRGLGLAAVDGIVRSGRGFIEAWSAIGAGATFRVLLPASGKKRAAEGEAPGPPQPPRSASIVLIVDDEEMVRTLASAILKRHGYEVLEAADGKQALEVLAAAPKLPAVIVLDLAMPVLGGDELLPILTERYPGIKVVISTGYAEEELRQTAGAVAVAGVLQKPYTAAELTSKIDEIASGGGGLFQLPKTG